MKVFTGPIVLVDVTKIVDLTVTVDAERVTVVVGLLVTVPTCVRV